MIKTRTTKFNEEDHKLLNGLDPSLRQLVDNGEITIEDIRHSKKEDAI